MNKQERLNKRISLLQHQQVLHEKNCAECPFAQSHSLSACGDCGVLKELNEIGDYLIKDTIERRNVQQVEVGNFEHGMMSDERLSIDDYLDLKDEGKSDKKIVELLNVTIASFKRWKDSKGLSNSRSGVMA